LLEPGRLQLALAIADRDAEIQTPVGDVVERDDVLGNVHRVQERQQEHRGLEPIWPVSGASLASIGIGCGHTVGCETSDADGDPGEAIVDAARTTSTASSMIAVGARPSAPERREVEADPHGRILLGAARLGPARREDDDHDDARRALAHPRGPLRGPPARLGCLRRPRVEGFRRAQHRYIGAGASGKSDPRAISAEHFTLSVMFVPPGQGNAAHTHEVEEVFFILDGKVKVFFEDGARVPRRSDARPMGLRLGAGRRAARLRECRPRARIPSSDARTRAA